MKNKIIAFDLDDVICYRDPKYEGEGIGKYNHCYPYEGTVRLINELYQAGFYIKIYTARGMTQLEGDVNRIYDELYQLTFDSLTGWGVKFHELIMGKIHYDILIDDKAMNSLDMSFPNIVDFLSEISKNSQ